MSRKWFCDKCKKEINEAGAITVFIGVSYLYSDDITRQEALKGMIEKLYCKVCAKEVEKSL